MNVFGWQPPKLPRPLRTTSFRLTVLYAGTFTASVLVLTGIIFWFVTRAMTAQIDATVSNELAEVQSDAAGKGLNGLKAVVDGMTDHSPGIYYLLQDPQEHVLAGNLEAIKPKPGIRQLTWNHRGPERQKLGLRGRGIMLADGNYLFVGLSNFELDEMQEAILRVLLWAVLVTLLLAFVTGFSMSINVLRRIEIISQTSRKIVSGNLDERIELRGTGDELDHLGISLNAMLDRIQELMGGLQHVSSDIAHDLRTPLTHLRNRLEIGRQREHPPETRALLDATIADADQILGTFGALLRIAQIEAGVTRSGFAEVDLGEIIGGLVYGYHVVAEASGQSLVSKVEPGLKLNGDQDLLTQLFANLIENAIRHTPHGTVISITAARASGPGGSAVKIIVADNGPGIPPDKYAKVLERFHRLEESRTTPGSGLGLSLVKAVADLHGAAFTFEDNRPGLRCVVVIPTGGPRPEDARAR